MNWAPYTKGFKVYLQLEKSLSKNTVEAYLNDVTKFTTYEEANIQRSSPTEISLSDLQLFIKQINETGLSARTQARIISSLKAFFKYLYLENIIRDDPASLLESPRPGRKLPDTLSVEEIDEIINTIDMSLPEGERNKAILETLYGCGLRVSELINLKITDIYAKDNFVKVIGKGNKERLVPIGNTALKHIDLYLENSRSRLHPDRLDEDILFLNRR